MRSVSQQMSNAIPTDFNVSTGIASNQTSNAPALAYVDMISAFKDALYQVKIEMDDAEMGRFVDKTMTSLVYT